MSNHYYWPWGSKSWLSALLGRSRKNVPKKHRPRSFSVDLIVGLDSSLFPCCWSCVGCAHVARAPSYQRASCAHPKKRVEYECLKGRNFDNGVRGQKTMKVGDWIPPFKIVYISIWNFYISCQQKTGFGKRFSDFHKNTNKMLPARWLDQFFWYLATHFSALWSYLNINNPQRKKRRTRSLGFPSRCFSCPFFWKNGKTPPSL